MSDSDNQPNQLGEDSSYEAKRQVVINPEDVNSGLEFWRLFKEDIPEELANAAADFTKTKSFEDQQRVKLALVKAITTSNHPVFKDEAFKQINEECQKVAYDMEFKRQLEEALAEED